MADLSVALWLFSSMVDLKLHRPVAFTRNRRSIFEIWPGTGLKLAFLWRNFANCLRHGQLDNSSTIADECCDNQLT